MKKIILVCSVCFCVNAFSQHTVKFTRDAGGNMTQRYSQQVNLRLGQKVQADSTISFKVYPNPTTDFVTIEGALASDEKEAQVLLYDVNGALLKKDNYYGTKKTFQLTGYAMGIYFLEVKYATKKSTNYRLVITE